MKLPSTIKDKLCAALGLGLVCGLTLPLEPAQAKSKTAKPTHTKPARAKSGTEPAHAKPAAGDKNGSSKSGEPALEAKQEPQQAPKQTSDPCPACGRG